MGSSVKFIINKHRSDIILFVWKSCFETCLSYRNLIHSFHIWIKEQKLLLHIYYDFWQREEDIIFLNRFFIFYSYYKCTHIRI